jgi:5-formyltetrahydrofolate cyclo-ligase
LELRHYTGKSCLQEGAFHIEEPSGENYTDYHEIELAIIPGISFDKKGNRLGRGKGYYDKLLPLLSSYNIGICYQFQAQESIPSEDFDKPMDEVWTEEGKWF